MLNRQDWLFIGITVVVFLSVVVWPALRRKPQPEPPRRNYRRYE